MRIVLSGADFEENLGLGMLAAVAEEAGHEVVLVPFNTVEETDDVVLATLSQAPDVVGLAIQFQHRAHEFARLSRALRRAGFRGHVTAGGQFPTLAWSELLSGGHGVDSVVLYEGEETLLELLDALSHVRPLADVPGLAVLSDDGVPVRTAPRRLVEDLDSLPFPRRYRPHTRHHGVPFIPIMSGRGCWGKCSYCSITSFYRDARAHGGGKTFRMRSPENVAAEMALLFHRAKTPSIFCFHDDNMTMPRPADTAARMRAIRGELDRFGVGKVGIVGKARPDTITPELATELAELGVIRLYVGVENASEPGGAHLVRGTQTSAIGEALEACDDAGIFVCYNLLVFEPHAKLEDVRENVAFIRRHATHPVNFCRAEPYVGTPLHRELESTGALGGSYLGFDYRIEDDRTELAFRMASAAFRERNFAPQGVANRYMGVGYAMKVLEHFYEDDGRLPELRREADRLTRTISLDTASFLERLLDFVERVDVGDRERIERETARLGLEIAAADRRFHLALDAHREATDAFARTAGLPTVRTDPTPELRRVARGLALGATLMLGTPGCGDDVVDPVPPDGGLDAGRDSGMVVDPPPFDAGIDSGMVVDPLPDDGGFDAGDVDGGVDSGMVVDPLPEDGGMARLDDDETPRRRLDLIDQWRDSSPRRARRSDDLPLFAPPNVHLVASADGEALRVRIEGERAVGARWESEGSVLGEGAEVVWHPRDEDDRLRVAVRTRGGVAVLSLRAPRASAG